MPMTGSADVDSPAPTGFVVPFRDEIVKVSLERLRFEPCRWQVDVCRAILSCNYKNINSTAATGAESLQNPCPSAVAPMSGAPFFVLEYDPCCGAVATSLRPITCVVSVPDSRSASIPPTFAFGSMSRRCMIRLHRWGTSTLNLSARLQSGGGVDGSLYAGNVRWLLSASFGLRADACNLRSEQIDCFAKYPLLCLIIRMQI